MCHVILPLYSMKGGIHVPQRSGLNQWNADGRLRDASEVYIPIPQLINDHFPEFFPSRNQSFVLRLPNRQALTAKVCQDGDKALMSNPNSDLGEWILREVLNIRPQTLVTYEMLLGRNIDSVIVTKINDNLFDIDIAPAGAYQEFIGQLL